ncbi:MAG: hypothetical protein LBK82_06300 [Planctomycetaceae bacterium]|nr:hypothetical protein [Planctomycetaceae bacterium]
MTPKRKATPFAVVHLIHCRRKWVGDLSLFAKRSPTSVVDSKTESNSICRH